MKVQRRRAGARALHPALCSAGPWLRNHQTRLVLFNLVGLTLIFIGWYRPSGIGSVATQLRWLNLAVAGLVVAAVGDALWLLHGRRGVTWARLVVIPYARGPLPESAPLAGTNGHAAVLVSGPMMTRYHRHDCLLVADKELQSASRPAHERAGLRPCEVCEP